MDIYEIEDLLKYDLDSKEWLQVVNNQKIWSDLFDGSKVKEYLQYLNKRYCEDNNLCPICRSELVNNTCPNGD